MTLLHDNNYVAVQSYAASQIDSLFFGRDLEVLYIYSSQSISYNPMKCKYRYIPFFTEKYPKIIKRSIWNSKSTFFEFHA